MHSSSLIPVEGHSNFKRDPKTNAIISTDNNDYEKYISERDRRKNIERKVEDTAKELSELKVEITEIKDLLLKIANK
jgi:hypothetical protein|tara:strand:- start:840 stop:1070 length:231 start_codon:yes stop_codon:yes gene_type:complete